MNLVILNKKYPKNDRYNTNTVFFTVNDIKLKIDIVYLSLDNDTRRFNCFLDNNEYKNVERIITSKFDIDWELFKKYFMYKLYKYSRGVGLDKAELNITPEEIKLIEST